MRHLAKCSQRLISASGSRMQTHSADLHLLEKMRVVAADFQLFVVSLDQHQLSAAKIASHTGDCLGIDDGASVNLPELLGIEFVDEFLDGLSDQSLKRFRLHSCVLFIRRKKKNFRRRYQAQLLPHAGLYPAQITPLRSTTARFKFGTQLSQKLRQIARLRAEALLQASDSNRQTLCLGRLQNIVDRTVFERINRILVVRGDEYDMTCVRNMTRRFDAGHAGHSNVEKREVGTMVVHSGDSLFPILRFRENLQVWPDFGETRAK